MNYILNLLQGMFEMNANPKDACIGFHKAFAYKWNRMKRKKKQKYLGNCVRRQRWNHKTNNYVFCTGASNGIKKTPKFKAEKAYEKKFQDDY